MTLPFCNRRESVFILASTGIRIPLSAIVEYEGVTTSDSVPEEANH